MAQPREQMEGPDNVPMLVMRHFKDNVFFDSAETSASGSYIALFKEAIWDRHPPREVAPPSPIARGWERESPSRILQGFALKYSNVQSERSVNGSQSTAAPPNSWLELARLFVEICESEFVGYYGKEAGSDWMNRLIRVVTALRDIVRLFLDSSESRRLSNGVVMLLRLYLSCALDKATAVLGSLDWKIIDDKCAFHESGLQERAIAIDKEMLRRHIAEHPSSVYPPHSLDVFESDNWARTLFVKQANGLLTLDTSAKMFRRDYARLIDENSPIPIKMSIARPKSYKNESGYYIPDLTDLAKQHLSNIRSRDGYLIATLNMGYRLFAMSMYRLVEELEPRNFIPRNSRDSREFERFVSLLFALNAAMFIFANAAIDEDLCEQMCKAFKARIMHQVKHGDRYYVGPDLISLATEADTRMGNPYTPLEL